MAPWKFALDCNVIQPLLSLILPHSAMNPRSFGVKWKPVSDGACNAPLRRKIFSLHTSSLRALIWVLRLLRLRRGKGDAFVIYPASQADPQSGTREWVVELVVGCSS